MSISEKKKKIPSKAQRGSKGRERRTTTTKLPPDAFVRASKTCRCRTPDGKQTRAFALARTHQVLGPCPSLCEFELEQSVVGVEDVELAVPPLDAQRAAAPLLALRGKASRLRLVLVGKERKVFGGSWAKKTVSEVVIKGGDLGYWGRKSKCGRKSNTGRWT